ncbi:MAG: HisA/HisF-related TIM barrel protein, partial [Gammaproteobacteria bacterium]|nr:HisA/HisF-related TIM barrel protein [Gammaproteobacteria bacterium]
MLVIPAIDIQHGKCVRLRQGRKEDVTVYDDDPLNAANRWVEAGAKRLHIVDLDGAMAGKPVNLPIIRKIADAHSHIPIQVGGGIRDEETVEN